MKYLEENVPDCDWLSKDSVCFLAKCSKFVSPYKKERTIYFIIYFTSTWCKNRSKNQEKFITLKMVTETGKIKKTKSVQNQILQYASF